MSAVPHPCTHAHLVQVTKGKAFTDNASVNLVPLPGGKQLLALSGGAAAEQGWAAACCVSLHGRIHAGLWLSPG